MSKIAVLVANMFEDVEYTKPAHAFIKAGHDLIHIGFKKDEIIRGKHDSSVLKIELAASDAKVDDYDALFIPGGYSPDQLRTDPKVVEFAKNFIESGKPVFAICHAPQILITADVLKGRKVTGWRSIVQDIKNAGAIFIDKEVVKDGNLISSREPNDIPFFIEASLAELKE